MITAEQLQQWRALADAATPGPLTYDGHHIYSGAVGEWQPHAFFENTADAALYSAAREAVPALLDEVNRLRGELATERARPKLEPTAAENKAAVERIKRINAMFRKHGRDKTQWPLPLLRELSELKAAQDIYEARYCQGEQ